MPLTQPPTVHLLLADSQLLPLLAVAALGLVIAMLMLRGQRLRGRRRGGEPGPSRQDSPWGNNASGGASRYRPGQPALKSDEENRWEVRMHEVTRELSGTLDSKMSALQALIAEADRAAERLERAVDASERRDK